MMKHFDYEKFFYWILGISAASIAFPYTNLGPITVILLFLFWLLYPPIGIKIELFKANWRNILILGIPFFI